LIHVLGGLVVTEVALLMAALIPVIWWLTGEKTDVDSTLRPSRITRWNARLVDELGLRPQGGLQSVFSGILVGMAVGLFTLLATIPITLLWRWLVPPPQLYYDLMGETLTPTSPVEFVLWILLMIFVVGFCEEVFARGVIQQGAENRYGRWGGLFLGALLFALIHLDPYRFAPLFFMSFIWGYMFQRMGWSLYVPWAAHATNNVIAIALLYLGPLIGL
jgi:membrane protease YdiL (CAAX protease family)